MDPFSLLHTLLYSGPSDSYPTVAKTPQALRLQLRIYIFYFGSDYLLDFQQARLCSWSKHPRNIFRILTCHLPGSGLFDDYAIND